MNEKVKQYEVSHFLRKKLNIFFDFYKEIWTWINGLKVNESELSLISDELTSNSTSGSCGSIALNKEHHLILKSAPCLSTKMRFVCEYCKE
jgi:hypothetical protein